MIKINYPNQEIQTYKNIKNTNSDIIRELQIYNKINKFNLNNIYYLHNSYHLGDNVFNLILFYIIKEHIEKNNIQIYYYAKKEHLYQLKEFICSENIKLDSLENKPNNSIEIWICNNFFKYIHSPKVFHISYNKFYINFFNNVLSKLKLNCSINKLFYIDNDLIERYDKIPSIYKDFDILILNSQPLSGQYKYDKNLWDNYIINLNKKFRVLTTTKVDGILCTYDNRLTIKDIASLSTKVKVIIAINSGVVPGLLNYYTLTNIKHFYNFDDRCFFSYPNFENKKLITDIHFEELEKYINQ